jgi:hypothetical protein
MLNLQIPPPERSANDVRNSAGPKKQMVTQTLEDAPRRSQINEHLRLNFTYSLPHSRKFETISCSDGITNAFIAKPTILQNGHRWRGFPGNRLIRQDCNFGSRMYLPNKMKARQCNYHVAEASQAIDHNLAWRLRLEHWPTNSMCSPQLGAATSLIGGGSQCKPPANHC